MPGSIRQRPDRGPNTFELRVFLGRDPRGRVKQKSAFFRGTRKQAEHALARMVADLDSRPTARLEEHARWGPTTTINDAISGWKANGWEDLSPSTTRRYESIRKSHIEDSIGRRTIAALSPYDVELYLRSLKTKGLSEASVRQTRALLHRACRLARKWSGNTLPNPVADTELPDWKLDEQRDAVRSPRPEEVRGLLQAAEEADRRVAAFIRLIAATGMRRGEACALRWGDVDFAGATVRVDEAVVAVDGGVVVKGPKSKAGIRRVALDPGTLASLAALRGEAVALAGIAELELTDRQFVFANEPPGEIPPHPDAMSHAFARVRALAGVATDLHLHSLRHFQATALDPVISETQKQARLGWATVHMARHYTDVIDEEDRRAAEHIGRLLADATVTEPQSGQGASRGTLA